MRGNEIVYLKTLEGEERVSLQLQGFGNTAKDYDIRVENRKTGAGMRVTGDRPMEREGLWSIRTTLAMEPFIAMNVEPGGEFTWKLSYQYYTLP